MSDQEMNEINQQIANYVDKIMDSRKKLRVRGLPKNIPGGLPIMENFPGGVGMKKVRKAKRGGIEGGKVINETKIVEIPTPDTASFVAKRTTLGGPASALKKAIGVFPFVGSGFKKGK
jgi:hypothetical protein